LRYEPSVRVPSYFPATSPKIAFVAQTPGKVEVEKGLPLVGKSGQLLEECCEKAGIDFPSCYRGNVIEFNPPGNDFNYFCGKKAEVGGKEYTRPPIGQGVYLRPDWFDEVERLRNELTKLKANVVVALGNESLWALCGHAGIGKNRGAVTESSLIPGQKVIPTWHPAGVLRNYPNKLDLILDLMKAEKESHFPEIKGAEREIWIYPDVKDLYEFERRYASPNGLVSVDIETAAGQVSCIGISWDPQHALVVPFYSSLRPQNNYWPDLDDELKAWSFVEHILGTYPVLGQNFYAYDQWFLLKTMGLGAKALREDTMIQHHAHMPEMSKDLGYLTSIYCNMPAYKTLRPWGQKSDKRDE